MNKDEQATETHDGTDAMSQAIRDLQQEVMEQAEQVTQVTSITGSAIDAAIQDERMIELERRIEELEIEAALSKEQRLRVAIDAAVINRIHGRLAKRLAKLETCAVINAETIGQVELLKVALVEQGMRIERLEAAIRVVNRAWDTVTEQSMRIERLEAALAASLVPMNLAQVQHTASAGS